MALVWMESLGFEMAWIWNALWKSLWRIWLWIFALGPMPKEQEIAMLEEQAKALQDDLDDVNRKLEEFRK